MKQKIVTVVTWLVVVFVLAPMVKFNYKWILFNGDFLYYHFLCPIVSLISFIFFEEHNKYDLKDNVRSMYPTLIYAVILIILNAIGKVKGPYPFLEVRTNSYLSSIIWGIGLIGSMFLLSIILTKIKKKIK